MVVVALFTASFSTGCVNIYPQKLDEVEMEGFLCEKHLLCDSVDYVEILSVRDVEGV